MRALTFAVFITLALLALTGCASPTRPSTEPEPTGPPPSQTGYRVVEALYFITVEGNVQASLTSDHGTVMKQLAPNEWHTLKMRATVGTTLTIKVFTSLTDLGPCEVVVLVDGWKVQPTVTASDPRVRVWTARVP